MTITNIAPGVYVSVTAAPPSPNASGVTSTWFVTGQTAQGPVGTPVPVTSMTDYANFLGGRVSYGFLYDALNEYFSDGGSLAYVSRLVGPEAGAAFAVIHDSSSVATLTFTAAGAGAWGNSLQVVVAAGTANNSFTVSIVNSGVVIFKTPNCFSPNDAVQVFNAQNVWQVPVVVTNDGSSTAAPGNNPAVGTMTLAGGSDDTADVAEAQWTNALAVFAPHYGPGQVSAPGHTTTVGYESLLNHAQANNRYAILDVADSGTASTLVAQAVAAQASPTVDPSYGAIFAPWVMIPGLTPSNPTQVSPVPTRTIPPSAVVAALMAVNDRTNDANNAVAGTNGQSSYAIGLTHGYNAVDRGTLNAAGVNVLRIPSATNAVTIYGNVTLSLDPNWINLNNARFRMQITNDCNNVGETFVFNEIDAQGHLFAKFNSSLAGLFQKYYGDGSIYGATPAQAFVVNTGPQVNTPMTIAAGEVNAQVYVVMSPAGNLVDIGVIKFSVSAGLPNTAI